MTGRNELISPCQTRLLKTFSSPPLLDRMLPISTTTPTQFRANQTKPNQTKLNPTKVKPIKRDAVDCLIVEAETIDSITWATKNSWEKKEGNTTWQHKHEAPIKTSTEKGLAKQKKPGQHTTHTLTRAEAGERKRTEDAWRAGYVETLSHAGFSWGQPQTLWICRQLFLPFFSFILFSFWFAVCLTFIYFYLFRFII